MRQISAKKSVRLDTTELGKWSIEKLQEIKILFTDEW